MTILILPRIHKRNSRFTHFHSLFHENLACSHICTFGLSACTVRRADTVFSRKDRTL